MTLLASLFEPPLLRLVMFLQVIAMNKQDGSEQQSNTSRETVREK